MDKIIDKNNWCVNLKETPEGELKELFKKWFTDTSKASAWGFGSWKYFFIINGSYNCGDLIREPLITLEQWHEHIYLKDNKSNKSITDGLREYFKNTPKEQVLKDWESTKEFDNIGVTCDEFLEQQLPEFPFIVEIKEGESFYNLLVGKKARVVGIYNKETSPLLNYNVKGYYILDKIEGYDKFIGIEDLPLNPKHCKIIRTLKEEQKSTESISESKIVKPIESEKTNENKTYPLKKDHICFDKGHSFFVVSRIDNGGSQFGHCKCGRCGIEENYQYDYN